MTIQKRQNFTRGTRRMDKKSPAEIYELKRTGLEAEPNETTIEQYIFIAERYRRTKKRTIESRGLGYPATTQEGWRNRSWEWKDNLHERGH